jgi:hypothetical protein
MQPPAALASRAHLAAFLDRWRGSGGAERANYQLFLIELCTVLDLPQPNPAGLAGAGDDYRFERAVTFHHPDGSTSAGRIDLYRRGSFVLEAKQGVDATDEAILERLVALNRERVAEEREGLIRWLRPEFQAPRAAQPVQKQMDMEEVAPVVAAATKLAWPKAQPEQAKLLRQALIARAAPATAAEIARSFRRAPTDRVAAMLATLAALGHAYATADGRFIAAS